MDNLLMVNSQDVYGAFELKRIYPKNYFKGLIIAVIWHAIILSTYFIAVELGKEDEDNIPMVRIKKYSELGPPPSITDQVAPQVAVSAATVKPTVGIPVPVPDADVSPEQTIATQTELSQMQNPDIIDQGATNVQIQQDIKIEEPLSQQKDDDPDMDAFVPVEKLPEPVTTVQPKYPELAQKAGIEGSVLLKVLVDKDGKPKKAAVIKSDSEMFNEAAIEAAMKMVFTPAIQNNKPIAVWVAIPFKFKLK